jgi:hypothetical protein
MSLPSYERSPFELSRLSNYTCASRFGYVLELLLILLFDFSLPFAVNCVTKGIYNTKEKRGLKKKR